MDRPLGASAMRDRLLPGRRSKEFGERPIRQHPRAVPSGAVNAPRSASSVDVALDGAGIANLRLVRIEAGAAPRSPLMQEVPALIERDLQIVQAFSIRGARLAAGFPLKQLVLLRRELVDPAEDVLVLHPMLLSGRRVRSIPRSRSR